MIPLRSLMLVLGGVLLPCAGFSEGDPEIGAKLFNKCRSCHAVISPEGDVLEKGGRTGPNLYGVTGRKAGTVDGYRYGQSLVDAGESGLMWDQDSFIAYIADPRAFLRNVTGDQGARSKMAFRLQNGGEDVFAFLESLSGEKIAP